MTAPPTLPEQEPVAWCVFVDGSPHKHWPLFNSEQAAVAAVMMAGVTGEYAKRWSVRPVY